jgi:hypothetical protein
MTVLFFEQSFKPKDGERCPGCDRAVSLALVEPHPTRNGLEIHTFNCVKCGPVRARMVGHASGTLHRADDPPIAAQPDTPQGRP